MCSELWKKAPLKYSLSPERPQIVETFIQQLMEGAEEAEGQVLYIIFLLTPNNTAL